jgi:hypothetical protein
MVVLSPPILPRIHEPRTFKQKLAAADLSSSSSNNNNNYDSGFRQYNASILASNMGKPRNRTFTSITHGLCLKNAFIFALPRFVYYVIQAAMPASRKDCFMFDLHLLAVKQAGRQCRLHARLLQQVAWVFVQIHSLTLFRLHAPAATQSRACTNRPLERCKTRTSRQALHGYPQHDFGL